MDAALIERTKKVFQPYSDRPLTEQDAETMVRTMTGVFALLEEWASREDAPVECEA